jgi:hypothetical protein
MYEDILGPAKPYKEVEEPSTREEREWEDIPSVQISSTPQKRTWNTRPKVWSTQKRPWRTR